MAPTQAFRNDARPRSAKIGAKVGRRSRGKTVGLIVRGRTFYVRWTVPRKLKPIIGKSYFVKSLRTGVLSEAVRKARIVGAEFEQSLRMAEGIASVPFVAKEPTAGLEAKVEMKTFEEVFNLFISDPTRKRTKKTISGYHETIEVLYDVLGRQAPIASIDREASRRLLETLQWLPTNAPKRFPTMRAVAVAEMAKSKAMTDTLGPVSINGYMTTLSSIMNFAVNEGFVGRNPARGLRVIDPIKKRDKRYPYSSEQLNTFFRSSIYQDSSAENRRTAKWLLPLIALFTGMRLNEICSLGTADIIEIDGISCFSIKEANGKGLKTAASERIIPVSQSLVQMGILETIGLRKSQRSKMLFPELRQSKNGHYSVEFSKWYGRYTRQLWAQSEASRKYCFHSYRHCFRDALREAKIEHEVALALGGWASQAGRSAVESNYGRGFSPRRLKDAIDKIAYLHQQAIDTGTPSGKLLFNMLGVFAEFERSIIRSRVIAGLERTRAKGTRLGRPPMAPLDLKHIRQSLEKGLSVRKAAAKHKTSTATVMRVRKSMAESASA